MKKIFRVICLLFININVGYSQFDLDFKIQYNPSTKYNQKMTQNSETEIWYSGTEEFLDTLKLRGVKNPTTTKVQSTTESVFYTGKSNDSSSFPVTMQIIESWNSEGKPPIPNNTIFYGHGTVDKPPKLDSIVSVELSEEHKKSLLQSLNATFSQAVLPERKMQLGDEFSTETPLTIPVAGVKVQFNNNMTYKLVSIKNGIGFFDISQIYNFQSDLTEYVIGGKGKGEGSFRYDILNSNYLEYKIETEIEINLRLESFDVDIITKSDFLQSTTINVN